MIKIMAPNKNYDGISAGVKFSKGVGECADPYLIEWFKEKGYEVEESTELTDEKQEPETKPKRQRKSE